MRRINLIIFGLLAGLSSFAQSVTTLYDGIELGDSTKLTWYGLYSSARFMSKGTSAFSLHFQNKNAYDFSKLSNTLEYTDFNASKKLKLSSSNFFEDYRNQLVIHSNNDTTATIESFGKPYAMLDFKVDFGSTFSGTPGSIGQLYAEQATPIVNLPSKLTMKSKQRLDLVHNHSFRLWENNTLRFWQTGDKIAINPIANILGSYSNPISTLDVNGDISSSMLAGIGKRQVFANEDGILETRMHEETFSYGINHIFPGDEDYSYSISFNSNLIYLNPTVPGEFLRCPLQIPNGVKIKNIKVYYRENSPTKNLFIQLLGLSHSSASYHLYQDLTLDNNTSAMQVATFTPNHTVNNSLASYSLVFSAQDGSSGNTWPSDQIAIRSVTVTVEY